MGDEKREVGDFILANVDTHSADIAPFLVDTFGFSRTRANFYLDREVKKGTLIAFGKTRAKRYFLAGGNHIEFAIDITPDLKEDKLWEAYIKPMLNNCSENVKRIANWGFHEIVNNAIDHSEGTKLWVAMEVKNEKLSFSVLDNGIGIFKKIQNALKLESERESILHLSKGKFTTDPENHSGQGIFFTSRMVGRFSIFSDDLYYSFQEEEWFLSSEKPETFGKGTAIRMHIPLTTTVMPKDILDMYSDIETGFHRTKVAVALSDNPNDPHNSRSQAKRLMAGLEKFTSVVLDFKDIKDVGQAFVDEVFRVFKNENPGIKIEYINAGPDVDAMIKKGIADSKSRA